MEDLRFFEKIFDLLNALIYTLLSIIGIIGIVALLDSNIIVFGICLIAMIICGIIIIEARIRKIILTRFVAMSENIYEITVILEKNN